MLKYIPFRYGYYSIRNSILILSSLSLANWLIGKYQRKYVLRQLKEKEQKKIL